MAKNEEHTAREPHLLLGCILKGEVSGVACLFGQMEQLHKQQLTSIALHQSSLSGLKLCGLGTVCLLCWIQMLVLQCEHEEPEPPLEHVVP